jgi:hypothetical protein
MIDFLQKQDHCAHVHQIFIITIKCANGFNFLCQLMCNYIVFMIGL